MIINYSFDDIDFKRQKNEILDIKNKNVRLKIYFKNYVKVYGVIVTIMFLIVLLSFKDIFSFGIMMLVIFLMWLVSTPVLYFFQFYEIEYDNIEEKLLINKWNGNLCIPKNKLKKVYIKTHHSRTRRGWDQFIYKLY